MEIKEIRECIASILDDLNELLPPEDINEVKYYIKYNELQISIEMLCDFISDSGVIIPEKISSKIKMISKKLNISDRYWGDLP